MGALGKGKSALQASLDAGEIFSMQQLLHHIEQNGWLISRNGPNYLGIVRQDGSRFRVRFSFTNDARLPPRMRARREMSGERQCKIATPLRWRGFWIYSLLALSEDGTRKACYVGQTVNLTRRFREHFHQRRPGHCSVDLFTWAAKHNAEIRCVVLAYVEGTQNMATRFEGYWLNLALDAEYEAPGVARWGKLPLPQCGHNQPGVWPAQLICAESLPLPEVVLRSVEPKPLFIASMAPLPS